jgi:hypothetical protein
MFPFSEQLYLRLHYNPVENALTALTRSGSDLAAAGSLVANLMLDRRILLRTDRLEILDPRPTQDALLDEALARLASIGRIDPNDPEWFRHFAEVLPLGTKLFQQLSDKGIFYRQEKKGFLGLSKTVTFPFRDPGLPTTLFENERAIMLHSAKPDPQTATQIFMAYCWGTDRPWKLSRQEEKQYEKRWNALFGDYWGWYDRSDPAEPIAGLDPDLRHALANLTISWATLHTSYYQEAADWL